MLTYFLDVDVINGTNDDDMDVLMAIGLKTYGILVSLEVYDG